MLLIVVFHAAIVALRVTDICLFPSCTVNIFAVYFQKYAPSKGSGVAFACVTCS